MVEKLSLVLSFSFLLLPLCSTDFPLFLPACQATQQRAAIWEKRVWWLEWEEREWSNSGSKAHSKGRLLRRDLMRCWMTVNKKSFNCYGSILTDVYVLQSIFSVSSCLCVHEDYMRIEKQFVAMHYMLVSIWSYMFLACMQIFLNGHSFSVYRTSVWVCSCVCMW